jgi:hypothetical protein
MGCLKRLVRLFARAASPEELPVSSDGTGRRASILDEHDTYLRERRNSGCANAAELRQEIRDRGYMGTCGSSSAASPASEKPKSSSHPPGTAKSRPRSPGS